jgi:hypothetical protein
MSATDNIKPGWLNIARRLQSLARRQHGWHSVVAATFVVDPDGEPCCWIVNKAVKLEPQQTAPEALQKLLDLLGS